MKSLILILIGIGVIAAAVVTSMLFVQEHVEEPQHPQDTEHAAEAVVELPPKDSIAHVEQDAINLDPNARVFEVKARNYAFDLTQIKVKKGETVTINFESTDGSHAFAIDAFEVKSKSVQPGTKTSVTFVADTVGEFEYYCPIGSHHAHGMTGTLIVEE
jgi:plastocyanin